MCYPLLSMSFPLKFDHTLAILHTSAQGTVKTALFFSSLCYSDSAMAANIINPLLPFFMLNAVRHVNLR